LESGGDGMEEQKDLKSLVEEDIKNCQKVWKEFSHDKDKMEQLFHTLLFRYLDEVDGFAEDMQVISMYEESARMAETYRENIRILMERLQAFRKNGYTNEGLREYYINAGRKGASFNLDFSEVRMELGMMEGLSPGEHEEINDKLGKMENICALVIPKRAKWEMLRGYVVWISGKNVDVAMKLLPLILKIN